MRGGRSGPLAWRFGGRDSPLGRPPFDVLWDVADHVHPLARPFEHGLWVAVAPWGAGYALHKAVGEAVGDTGAHGGPVRPHSE